MRLRLLVLLLALLCTLVHGLEMPSYEDEQQDGDEYYDDPSLEEEQGGLPFAPQFGQFARKVQRLSLIHI